MSETIHKFRLAVVDRQTISLPVKWEALAVDTQHDAPHLWVRVDPDAPTSPVPIYTHGTGHLIHPNATKHLGSYQLQDGDLVFHVFAQKEDRP